jgi:hypothetical protein
VLGHQFPDHERGVRHAGRHDDDGKRLAIDRQDRNEQEHLLKAVGQCGTAEYPCECRAGGKADLNGSQHARRIGCEREGNLGSRSPFLCQTLQMRAPRGHDGEFRQEKAPFSMNSTKTTMISRISIFNFYQPINCACTKASGKTVAKNQPRFPAARRWQAFCTSGRTRS